MIDLGKVDQIAARLAEALPPGAARLREDMESRFRSVLKGAFEKMDLVTREEFEAQLAALERATRKLDALESRLAELERGQGEEAG